MRLATGAMLGNGTGRQRRPPKARTYQLRDFTGGMNLTDSRVAIKDSELAWLENVIPIGSGALQVLPGPGPAVATLSQGIRSVWGFTLNNAPIFVAVGNDGSLTQVTPGGVTTVIAGAGTCSGDPHVTIWRGTTILILDPQTGYFSWDGAVLTTIAAGQVGTALAIFQGRAWLVNGRTVTFTAPNTYNNFAAADGAGSTILTDEAFPGNIVAAVSALEQLWLVGTGAIEAISNVAATGTSPNVTTTFSVTNIVTNLGSPAQHSVQGYFRALTFAASFGVYALSGVTPQKISDKLDGLFPLLTIAHDTAIGGVAVVQNLLCLVLRITYNGQSAAAGPGPVPLVLVFSEGRWAFAAQGALTWITSVIVNGVPQAWGTDGQHIYQLFGASAATPVRWRVRWKLSDFGLATTMKVCLKTGLEFQAAYSTAPTMRIENETSSQEPASVETTVPVTWVNQAGEPVQFVNSSGQLVTWVVQGMVLSRQVSTQSGHYLGFSLDGTDPPFLIQAVQLEIEESTRWGTP